MGHYKWVDEERGSCCEILVAVHSCGYRLAWSGAAYSMSVSFSQFYVNLIVSGKNL